ncbi:MAG: hypothetical protein J5958_05550 [Clostridia bacterium]|nr:hypothetical protein [Clostridia bacterium]
MIPKYVSRSDVYREFTPEQAEDFFSLTEKKVLTHLDNLYYTVFIRGDHGEKHESEDEVPEIRFIQDENKFSPDDEKGIRRLLDKLEECKESKSKSYDSQVQAFDLQYFRSNHAIYEHRLSFEEYYDIFVASYLPNDDTPRIEVQIRTASLVLLGVDAALRQSFNKVVEMLRIFGLSAIMTRENRLDYAFHTNLIQKPIEFFSDGDLLKHTVSTMRNGQKVFDLGKEIDLSYFALGNRRSNNVFFRAYNKSREVVEMGYKSFFFDRWKQNGLISQYDYEVYCDAYERKSYTVGILVGRIKWYLKHGKDLALKKDLERLLKTCYDKNSNTDEIRQRIKGVLPDVTVICNIEFETKRKFYHSWQGQATVEVPDGIPVALIPIYRILEAQPIFLDYLTNNCVRFVKDREKKGSGFMDWWARIRSAKPGDYSNPEFKRIYRRQPDLERAKRRFAGDVAYLSMLLNENVEDRPFVEDLSDSLANLNDNNFFGSFVDPVTGEVALRDPRNYESIRQRRAHQNKRLIKQMHEMLEEQRREAKEQIEADLSEDKRISQIVAESNERHRYEEDLYRDSAEARAHRAKFVPAETDADLIAMGARDPDAPKPEGPPLDPMGRWKQQLLAKIKRDRKNK